MRKPLEKALSRAKLWGQVALGLQFAAVVYRVYVASTLSFVLQLDNLPTDWPAWEGRMMRALVPGPSRWSDADDLHGLRRDFGFAQDFPDLRQIAAAAKLRVMQYEARQQGGLQVQEWLRRLADAERAFAQNVRLCLWRGWFDASFCHILAAATRDLRAEGISALRIRRHAAGEVQEPFTPAQEQRARQHFQRSATTLLQNSHARFPEVRMRQRLEHWDLPLFPRIRAQRAVAMLQRLSAMSPPRVFAAVLRTLWSGWCTARRFGGRSHCVFCGMEDADSLEHATVCRVLANFGHDFLRLRYHALPGQRRLAFLLLEPASQLADETLLLGAIRVTAAYHVHCRFRRSTHARGGREWARRALEQRAKEAVLGHPRAMSMFDARWLPR